MPLPPLGPMEPGRYADDSTGMSIEFMVSEGWDLAVHPGDFQTGPVLAQRDHRTAQLALTSFQGQVFGTACWNDDNRDSYLSNIVPVRRDAESLISYLAAHEFLDAVSTESSLGGRDATQLDVRVAIPDECLGSAALWEIPPNWYHSIRGDHEARFIVTDTDVGTFVVFITAPAEIYPEFLERSMEVVDSLSFVDLEN